MLNMEKVLVTGGAGFIGSNLTNHLLGQGKHVTVIDNLSCGKKKNILDSDALIFYKSDIRNQDLLEELIKNNDIVFHLAALSRVLPSLKNPKACFENNVSNLETIVRLAVKFNKKLVFCSSREIYGNAKYLPVDENHELHPVNPYGLSKLMGEKIINESSNSYGLRYSIVRLTNVYGLNDFNRVIPSFIDRSLTGKPLIFYGGEQLLDFIHVNDVINALIKAALFECNITVNIGSGKATSIKNLARIIQKLTGTRTNYIIRQQRNGEVQKFVAEIKKAADVLNWRPTIPLEKGIRELIITKQKTDS